MSRNIKLNYLNQNTYLPEEGVSKFKIQSNSI